MCKWQKCFALLCAFLVLLVGVVYLADAGGAAREPVPLRPGVLADLRAGWWVCCDSNGGTCTVSVPYGACALLDPDPVYRKCANATADCGTAECSADEGQCEIQWDLFASCGVGLPATPCCSVTVKMCTDTTTGCKCTSGREIDMGTAATCTGSACFWP